MDREAVLKEIKRKSIHTIPGFAAIPIVVWLGKIVAIPIAILFLVLYTLNELYLAGLIRRPIPIATHTFHIMARREEIEKKTFIGTVIFWSATVLIIAFLPPEKAAAAIMVSSFGDAAAAIVGKAMGIAKLPYSDRKTLGGFLAMLATSILCYIVAGIELSPSLVVAFASMVVESLTPVWYLDELTVPATVAILLALM